MLSNFINFLFPLRGYLFSVLLYMFLITIIVIFTQLIGFGVSIFSGLFLCSVVPVKPADDKRRRLTNKEKEQFTLSQKLTEILVGLILGDLNIEKQKGGVNARLRFEQGVIHKEYLFHLYSIFQEYCSQVPMIQTRNPLSNNKTGKIHNSIRFKTYSLPCFNELYNLIYPANGSLAGRKIVPLIIEELLTPLGLAYWICDDGSFCQTYRVVILNTQGFTKEEVELLAKTLNDKWDLKCTINKDGNGYRIRIPQKSLPILHSLLGSTMPTMMQHKIGL